MRPSGETFTFHSMMAIHRPPPAPSKHGPDLSPPRPRRRRLRLRRLLAVALAVFLVVAGISFVSSVYGKPGSLGARAAEWVRDHGGSQLVATAENLWYSHHQPPVGGRPKAGLIPKASSAAAPRPSVKAPAHLPVPAPIVPIASPRLPGEGLWHPAGRVVDGVPTMYEAFLRPDPVHTSLVAGVAWMDTKLLKASLYSGSYIPGGGPWALTAPISTGAAATVTAAFNSGFRLKDSQGGCYTQGRIIAPLRNGAASAVIYRNGSITVGQWGRDVSMTPDVVAVRQNLSLIVDGGAPAAGLSYSRAWGGTIGNQIYVWRSGVGVTADGALVYVGGPGLDVPSLAGLLVRAGAVRAMELDINTDWVNFAAYTPTGPGAAVTPSNGTELLSGMSGGTGRYFLPYWNRDFFTMSVASPTTPSTSTTGAS